MDIAKLKELALAANHHSKGWKREGYSIVLPENDMGAYSVCECLPETSDFPTNEIVDNLSYIAAANPAAVLELITEVENLRFQNVAIKVNSDGLVERLEDAARSLSVAQEHCNRLLDQKNEWADRARKAEGHMGELLTALTAYVEFEQDRAGVRLPSYQFAVETLAKCGGAV